MNTGSKHFACQDNSLIQIFKLNEPNSEKILSNINVVVSFTLKRKTAHFFSQASSSGAPNETMHGSKPLKHSFVKHILVFKR